VSDFLVKVVGSVVGPIAVFLVRLLLPPPGETGKRLRERVGAFFSEHRRLAFAATAAGVAAAGALAFGLIQLGAVLETSGSNHDPVVKRIRVEREPVCIGETIWVTVDAYDEDGDPMSAEWTVLHGRIEPCGPTSLRTTHYTAPEELRIGDERIEVIVKDNRGGEAIGVRPLGLAMGSGTSHDPSHTTSVCASSESHTE
jgi:hypothetical protein